MLYSSFGRFVSRAALAAALFAGSAPHSSADVIVAPNAYANAVAEYEVAGAAGSRYQQVFNASQFWPAGETHNIRAMAWRPGKSLFPGVYTWSIPQFDVWIATTDRAANGLSAIFAENYAASPDRTLVYSGPITFSATLLSYGGPHAFDLVIPFNAPFSYSPASGNLLVEVACYDHFANLWNAQIDLVATSDVTSYVWGASWVDQGTPNGFSGAGVVTAFDTDYTPAPEPSVVLKSFVLNPAKLTGGASLVGTIKLTALAPAGGVAISLASNSPAAHPPASVRIPAGAKGVSFTIPTSQVNAKTVAILSARAGASTLHAKLVIKPSGAPQPSIYEFEVDPLQIPPGEPVTGLLVLSDPAPAGGSYVEIATSDPSALSAPASVYFPPGVQETTFSLTRGSVSVPTPVAVSATIGASSKVVTVTVLP